MHMLQPSPLLLQDPPEDVVGEVLMGVGESLDGKQMRSRKTGHKVTALD
jgi:hypothetical protein